MPNEYAGLPEGHTRTDVETAGIILAERLHGGSTLVARHLALVPDHAYAIRQRDRIRIDPVAFNRFVRPSVLTGEVLERAQRLLDNGHSVAEVAAELKVLRNTLQKAIGAGRLRSSLKKTKKTQPR